MRRVAWPLASTLLALSACNALTGVAELSTCPSCDEHPDVDASTDARVTVPETSTLGEASADASDATTRIDADKDADADAPPPIGCQSALACVRVVFATSLSYTGDLGGVTGADAKCQLLADHSTLARVKGRTFLAWVSTTATSPSARMVHGTMAYIRTDGVTIASSWSDLTDGTLQNGISPDEDAGNRNGAGAWTGTNSNGADYAGAACADWTALGIKGVTGNVGGNGGGWSGGGAEDCTNTHALYCVEQ